MKFSFLARVYRSGKALVITIPKDYVEVYGIKPGMRVKVIVKIIKKSKKESEENGGENN